MKVRTIAAAVSIASICTGMIIALKANQELLQSDHPPFSAGEDAAFKKYYEQTQISNILFFGGIALIVSFPVIDFIRWAKE